MPRYSRTEDEIVHGQTIMQQCILTFGRDVVVTYVNGGNVTGRIYSMRYDRNPDLSRAEAAGQVLIEQADGQQHWVDVLDISGVAART